MRIFPFFLLLVLSGCVGPNYERPLFPLPSAWKNQTPSDLACPKKTAVAWWKNFSDPQLEALIAVAVQSNLDYLTAQARIREARANLMTVETGLFPSFNGVGSTTTSHSGPNVPKSANSTKPSGTSTSSASTLYMAGFDATWEIDIFGGARRVEESAMAIMESVVDDAQATLISLIAEIAQNYINLRNYQHQLEMTKKIAALWMEHKTLQESLEKAGLTSHITTATAESSLGQALAAIPPLEASLKAALHRLGVLLGKDPGRALPSAHAARRDSPDIRNGYCRASV